MSWLWIYSYLGKKTMASASLADTQSLLESSFSQYISSPRRFQQAKNAPCKIYT